MATHKKHSVVEEASMESFPASDAPAWTGGNSIAERSNINLSEIQIAWHKKGFSCDLWTDPPGQCWENFTHPLDELFELVEGDVELEMDGEVIHLKPGEEVFIPANTVHSVRNIGKTVSRWLFGYKEN